MVEEAVILAGGLRSLEVKFIKGITIAIKKVLSKEKNLCYFLASTVDKILLTKASDAASSRDSTVVEGANRF